MDFQPDAKPNQCQGPSAQGGKVSSRTHAGYSVPQDSQFGLCQAVASCCCERGTWGVLDWRLLWKERGAQPLHVPLLLIKASSPPSSTSTFPIAKAPLGAEKLSFASTPENIRSSFALRLPTLARQAPPEIELQVKALSGSHSPSTDFSQRD